MVDPTQKQKRQTVAYTLLCLLAILIVFTLITKPNITLAQAATASYTPSPYTPSVKPTPSNTPTTIPTIAAAISNRAVITVDNATGLQKYRAWQAQYGAVSALVFIPQTSRLISGGYDANDDTDPQPIRIWELQEDSITSVDTFFKGFPNRSRMGISSLSLSPDGSLIAVVINNRDVNVWNTQTGDLVAAVTQSHINTSAIDMSNYWLLAGGQMQFMAQWNINSLVPTLFPTEVAFNPQGQLNNIFPIDEDVSQVDYDADTHQVFALTLTGRLVIYKFVNERDYAIRFVPQAPASVLPPAWGLEGSHKMTLDSARHEITYTDTNRDVIVYDFVADKVVSRLSWGQPTGCLDYSADKRFLVMSDWGYDMTLHIIDTVSWKSIAQIPTGQALMACALSWDNKWIATGDPNGQIILWGVPAH
jgi:WD40 repeat protein